MMVFLAKALVALEHVEPYMMAEAMLTVWELAEVLLHRLG